MTLLRCLSFNSLLLVSCLLPIESSIFIVLFGDSEYDCHCLSSLTICAKYSGRIKFSCSSNTLQPSRTLSEDFIQSWACFNESCKTILLVDFDEAVSDQ